MSKDFQKDKQSSNKKYHQQFDFQALKEGYNQNQISSISISCQIINYTKSPHYKLLTESQRFYKKSDWASHIKQNCIDTDFQSINIQLHYGPFATKINVIYLEVVYKEEPDSFINSGSFGRIQTCVFKDQTVAVKLIKLNQNKQFSAEIERVYQQYFIALMASELKVGPQLINVFGYQIVFLKNYALFGMELCEKFSDQNLSQKKKITDFQQSLKNSLQILHSLHVVHRDIKPENIMWSPSFQKLVFIDFGLSEIVKERQGEKTLTSYVGSYSYCSPEMQKCFVLQKSRHVDLYENDVFGLEKSLKIFSIVNPIKAKLFIKTQTKNEFFDCLVQISNLKMQCFLRNFEDVYQFLIKCKYALKTCLYISNKIKEKQKFSEQKLKLWDNWQNLAKQKLIKNKLVISYSEQLFLKAIQGNMKNSFSYLLPFSSFLENQLRNLNKWIHNEMWISRIYFILNPTSKSSGQYQFSPEIIHLIVDKIYNFLEKIPTQIFTKKIRRVLLFFYQKFSQLKNKELLESLSDFFYRIGDHFSSIKIRNYILTIIQNPLQYCLKNLMYYVLNYKYTIHSRGISIDSLENIKRISNFPLSERYPEIIQIVQRLCQNQQYSIGIIEEVLNFLEILKKKISLNNPQFSYILNRILMKFKFIFLGLLNIEHFVTDFENKFIELKELRSKLKKQISEDYIQFEQKMILQQLNHQFYQGQISADKKKFNETHNENFVKEFLQTQFQINQNKKTLTLQAFQVILQSKFKTDLSVIILTLKQRIKYVVKFQILYIKNLKLEIYMIILEIGKNIEALCDKIDKNNDDQREQAQKLINYAFEQLRQRVKLSIQNEEEKKFLLDQIDIFSLIRVDYQDCQQQILKKGKQLCQKFNSYNPPDSSKTHILSILVNILRKKYFKKQANIVELENLIFRIFKSEQHFHNFFIFYEEILKKGEIFKFEIGFGFQFIGLLANYLACLDSTHPHFYRQTYTKTIITFVGYYNTEEITNIFIQLHTDKYFKYYSLAQHIHGCYFIFKMLQNCNKKLKYIQKYLFKIAKCMAKVGHATKLQILESYYVFFTNLHKKKVRKLLICQRLETRHNFLQKNMKWTKAKVQKKSQKYPQIVNSNLFRKLYLLFG